MSMAVLAEYRAENNRLRAVNADLLFSLKALTLFLKDRTETSHLLNVAMEQARAAIAKAEGNL
jgi:hypothetical protein